MIPMFQAAGSPAELGRAYGKAFAGAIRRNLSILVWREQHEPLPRSEPAFRAWVADQEDRVSRHWPWLAQEMAAVADGAGLACEDILLLNLRAWQYNLYGAPDGGACSSLAVRLADGTVANAGALDDPVELYCGPVRYVPDAGHRFISFPITGTSWGNRGMNSAGLAVGISSQQLPGLRRLPHAVNQDLAMRVILQTCSTVADVRAFCEAHPFTMNMVCTDAAGLVWAVHHTQAGPREVASAAPCALTNHVVDDRIVDWLHGQGVREVRESPTTRFRRGRLLAFAALHDGRCIAEQVRRVVADRDGGDPASICPPGNIVVTYANSQAEPEALWIAQPQVTGTERWARLVI